MHADTDFIPGPGLLHTTFIALQPVTRALGPTRFLPGTHAARAPHAALEAMGDVTGLRRTRDAPPPPSFVSLLSTGDASLYDGKILHCGGANSWRQPSWRQPSRGSTTYVSERRPHLPGRQPSLLAAADRGRPRRVCRKRAPSVASQPASGDGMRVLFCSVLKVPSWWCQRWLPRLPGTHGFGAGLLLHFQRSASAAQTPVAACSATVHRCQGRPLPFCQHRAQVLHDFPPRRPPRGVRSSALDPRKVRRARAIGHAARPAAAESCHKRCLTGQLAAFLSSFATLSRPVRGLNPLGSFREENAFRLGERRHGLSHRCKAGRARRTHVDVLRVGWRPLGRSRDRRCCCAACNAAVVCRACCTSCARVKPTR